MASVPSSPRRTALSAAESATTTHQSPKKEVKVEGDAIKNGVFFADEKKPDLNDGLDHLDSPQCIERFTKYENEYTHRLLAKYFSGKSLNGGTSFYEETTIDGEIVKSSKAPCFRLYADPVVGFEEQCINGLSSPAETDVNTPNGKHTVSMFER
ncbi:hypothetical protein P8452_56157 [Trifolium repens]|nr:hypothetical protein P8452_56157 [Trifolium repens]